MLMPVPNIIQNNGATDVILSLNNPATKYPIIEIKQAAPIFSLKLLKLNLLNNTKLEKIYIAQIDMKAKSEITPVFKAICKYIL